MTATAGLLAGSGGATGTRRAGFWWRVGVTTVALVILVSTVDRARFAEAVGAADVRWLLAVVAIISADKAWMAGKWLLLARAAGLALPAGVALKAYYVGSLWGSLLPASVGGDVVRVSWLARRGLPVGALTWSVVVERVLGALAQAATGLAGLLLLARSAQIAVPALGGALVVVAGVTATATVVVLSRTVFDTTGALAARLQWRRVERALATTKLVALAYRRRRALMPTFLALSMLEQAFPVASTFALARAFSIDVQLGWLVAGVPVILAIARLPVSLSDYGIKEGAYVLVLALAGLSPTDALVIATVDRVLVLLAMLPGALWSANPCRPATGALRERHPAPGGGGHA